jgi:CTP synthase (UTP-ammonia lyase)
VSRPLRVGIIGDFDASYPSHAATNAALSHVATALSLAVDLSWLATRSLDDEGSEAILSPCDALWCAPGSPYKSMDGALKAIQFAREKGRPFVGT